eukprot:m.7476 g.7476  ORF g.7476 m.7476 type:complete len:145 (+) comp2949_c0_seq1:485-919(+)
MVSLPHCLEPPPPRNPLLSLSEHCRYGLDEAGFDGVHELLVQGSNKISVRRIKNQVDVLKHLAAVRVPLIASMTVQLLSNDLGPDGLGFVPVKFKPTAIPPIINPQTVSHDGDVRVLVKRVARTIFAAMVLRARGSTGPLRQGP